MVASSSKRQTHRLVSKKKSSSSSKKTSAKSAKSKIFRAPSSKRDRPRIPRWFVISGAIVLILLVILYLASIQLSFIIEEEIIISLSPTEESFTVHYTDEPQLNISVEVDNLRVCKFTCAHTLIDLSNDSVLYNHSFYDQNVQELTHSLPLNSKGDGQKMFNYKVTCNNIKSRFCSTDEKTYFKTSLITVNYALSPDEESLKEKLSPLLSSSLRSLTNIRQVLNSSNSLFVQLNYLQNTSFSSEELDLQSQLTSQTILLESFEYSSLFWLDLWAEKEYLQLSSSFTLEDFDAIAVLESSSMLTYSNAVNLTNRFNSLVDDLIVLSSDEETFILAEKFYIQTNDSSMLSNLQTLVIQSNALVQKLVTKDFSSFEKIFLDAEFFNLDKSVFFEDFNSDKLSLVQGSKQELELLEQTKIYLVQGGGSVPSISYAVTDLSDVCAIASNALPLLPSFNQDQLSNQNNLLPFLQGNSLLKNATSLYLDFVLNTLRGQTVQFILPASVYGDILLSLNGTNTSYNLSALSQSSFASITPIDESLIFDVFNMSYCSSSNSSSFIPSLVPAFENLSLLILPNYPFNLNQTFEVPLLDEAPQCCVYGVCTSCCEGTICANENYPVIFVHGHAISKENRPEMSHESFAKWQDLLETDGYINAGQLGENTDIIPDGDWGRMSAPVTMRVSYYVLSYYDLGSYQLVAQKSDKIENYALRLNEKIDLIKQRTGKDKVIIVAHSMGGLVVREYLSVFGEDSVDKFLLLGTPNYGVEGRVKRLCSLTGSSKECTEMGAGSIFLKRLNSPLNDVSIPSYTLRALGCDMSGEDGDGIVLGRNVLLPFSTNFILNGTCTDSLETDLHTNMLDPDLYPETFTLVKDFIQGVTPLTMGN